MSAGVAVQESDLGFTDIEVLGEKVDELIVGFAFVGDGGDADFELVAFGANDFGLSGIWEDFDGEQNSLRCSLPKHYEASSGSFML